VDRAVDVDGTRLEGGSGQGLHPDEAIGRAA